MSLQQTADVLNYKRDDCEHCGGQRYHRGGSMCRDCKGRGYLWYPNQDPAIPCPSRAGITTEQLMERWQQRQASQQP